MTRSIVFTNNFSSFVPNRRAYISIRHKSRSCNWRTSRWEVSCAVWRLRVLVRCMPRWWHVWRPWKRNTPPWRGTRMLSVASTSGVWTTSPTRWSAPFYPKRFIAMLSLPRPSILFFFSSSFVVFRSFFFNFSWITNEINYYMIARYLVFMFNYLIIYKRYIRNKLRFIFIYLYKSISLIDNFERHF